MDENTTWLKLPYLAAGQAQKHVTHNEALRMLDAIVHIRVEDRGREAPPALPEDGQRFALGAVPSGAFAGKAGMIAARQDGAWAFYQPYAGWIIWDAAEAEFLVHDGEGWRAVFDPQNLRLLGVNTSADEINRLAVSSAATLLTHAGGGHQLKLNKAATGDTASLLFQSDWSGHAEMGLAGSNDFAIKVSADGAAWHDALVAEPGSGRVSFPAPPRLPSYTVAGLPAAAGQAGALALIGNEAGGAVVAFSDGANWRRVTDRAVVG